MWCVPTRQSTTRLSAIVLPAPRVSPHLPKGTKLELGRGADLGTRSSANHTAAASQPTGRIAKAASWLHLSRVSPALHPPERPSHTHTPKPGIGERVCDDHTYILYGITYYCVPLSSPDFLCSDPFHHVLFRPLFCRPAPFPLVLGCSRSLVGVDAEGSEVVQETPHLLFFLPPHTARAPHQFSEHHALRQSRILHARHESREQDPPPA